MSNTQRPSLQKKHTRATDQARDEQMNQGLRIVVDGETYEVRQGDMTALDTFALRREIGMSFVGVMRAFQTDPDVDLIAAIVWLSRRINGEKTLTFAEVAGDIGYDVELDLVEEPGAESDPEA